ncbi:hypothetical protein LXL04_034545 [Taraxacum kok-saghyz]
MRYVRLLYIAQQEQRPSSTASSSTSHNKNTDSNSSSQCNRLHQYHRRQPLLPFSSSVKIDPAGKHITNTDSVFSYSEEAHVVETSTNPHASKPAMAVLRYTSMYMLLLVVTLVQYFFTSGSSPGYVVYAMREYARTEASLRASEISKNGGIGFGTCNRPIMLKDSAAGGIFGKLLKTGVGSRPRGSYASIKKSNKRGCFVSSSKPSVGGIFGKSGVVFFNFVLFRMGRCPRLQQKKKQDTGLFCEQRQQLGDKLLKGQNRLSASFGDCKQQQPCGLLGPNQGMWELLISFVLKEEGNNYIIHLSTCMSILGFKSKGCEKLLGINWKLDVYFFGVDSDQIAGMLFYN